MKTSWFSYLALISSISFAQNSTVLESFAETFPDAVTDAALVDLPLCSTLYGFGLMPIAGIPLCAGAAVTGYAIRKTCNNYGYNGTNSAFCGFLGGAVKYSMKSFSRAELLLGAVDGGTYEGTAKYRGAWLTAEFMAIEAGVSGLAYLLRPRATSFSGNDLMKEARFGATIGMLISGFLQTTYSWYSADLRTAIKNMLSSSNQEEGEL
ncbi:MAG: hypothetical protein WCK42_01505 [Myxococcaceae bacterium]